MSDLVTGGEDCLDRMRVRLDRMTRDEEGGDDSPLREYLENPLNPQNRVLAARGRARGGRTARTDPDRDCVEVECQADGGFGHGHADTLPGSASDSINGLDSRTEPRDEFGVASYPQTVTPAAKIASSARSATRRRMSRLDSPGCLMATPMPMRASLPAASRTKATRMCSARDMAAIPVTDGRTAVNIAIPFRATRPRSPTS